MSELTETEREEVKTAAKAVGVRATIAPVAVLGAANTLDPDHHQPTASALWVKTGSEDVATVAAEVLRARGYDDAYADGATLRR